MGADMIAYLIEDDALKANRLTSLLNENFPALEIKMFGSFQSGLRAAEAASADFMILDMTLPTFDRLPNKQGGRLRPLGGYDLMRKLRLRAVRSKIIVVTQLETFGEADDQITFAEITARCKREFPDTFVGSVYFRQGELVWQEELIRLVHIVTGIDSNK